MAQLESSRELTVQAESGDVAAQYRLGVLLLLGERVSQDIEKAYWWLSRAAIAEHAGAQALLPAVAALQAQAGAKLMGMAGSEPIWERGISFLCRMITRPVQAGAGFVASAYGWALRVLRRRWKAGPMLAGPVGEERRRHAPFVDAA